MTWALTRTRRVVFATCLAAFALACGHSALALPDARDLAADRAERKRAASKGKPLPGTPDLSRLDERLAKRGLPNDAAIMIRIFKAESELEVWIHRGGNARYALFATYPICNWSGTLGPKLKEGDRQAPEGFYTVNLPQANPNGPRWPKSLDIGFPNSFDRLHARSGSAILIHGGCASIGCFAMTNGVNKELHTLAIRALDAGQSYVPIHVFPFRMTQENLTRYDRPALRGFWHNLKEGHDLFERTRRPPRVSICGSRYDFEASDPLDGANPGPIAVCPTAETLLKQLAEIKSLQAIEPIDAAPPVDPTRLAVAGSALWEPAHGHLIERGPNSMAQLAPKYYVPNASPSLLRPLSCSLALTSCRKYVALREKLLQKASADLEPPVVKKKRAKKRRYRHKRKRHRRNYDD
jgi:murein L,D-transpeptidase YafK